MSKRPAAPNKPVLKQSERLRIKRSQLKKQANRQTWILLAIVVAAIMIDWLASGKTGTFGTIGKSVALGATLSWLTQAIFTKIALGLPKSGGQQMVTGLYLGQLTKWLLTLIGFAIIFMFIRPISALSVLLGFMVMQVTSIITLTNMSQKD